MSKMEFGVFDNFGISDMAQHATAADAYDTHIRDAQTAEQGGYQYYFFIEHQNAPFAQMSAPNVFFAALARETSTLRFGPMIYQLPLHHPMRLAQDAAMVDNLSRGRLEFGTGTGVLENEFIRWNVPFAERRAMAQEALEIITKAWTQESVDHHGKYWQFDEAFARPKPYQQPHPPIWVGAHSDTSFDYAAKHNYNVAQNIDTDEVAAAKFARWREVWKTHNHPGPMPRTLLVRHVHVAETDEKARQEAEPALLKGFLVGFAEVAATRIGKGTSPGGMAGEEVTDYAQLFDTFHQTTQSFDYWIDSGVGVVGSPDTVIRMLKEKQEKMGLNIFLAQHVIDELPPDLCRNSMDLFAKHVIPAFN